MKKGIKGQIAGGIIPSILTFALLAALFFSFGTDTNVYAASSTTVYFGNYYQEPITDESELSIIRDYCSSVSDPFTGDRDTVEGVDVAYKENAYYKKTPIEWQVLSDNGSTYTLISKKVLERRMFSGSALGDGKSGWPYSEIREWLNNVFYSDAFSVSEQNSIVTTTLENTILNMIIGEGYFTEKEITKDNVWLLDQREVLNSGYGFDASEDATSTRIANATKYIDSEENPQNWYLRGDPYWFYYNAYTGRYIEEDGTLHQQGGVWDGSAGGNYEQGIRPVIEVSKAAVSTSPKPPQIIRKEAETKVYTIKYNLNGGKGTFRNQTKKEDKVLTLYSKKPTKKGYTFQGWATSKKGKVAYKAGSKYKVNKSVTLYAKWKKTGSKKKKSKGNVYGVAIAGFTSQKGMSINGMTRNSADLFVRIIKKRYPKTYKCKAGNIRKETNKSAYTKEKINKIIKKTYRKKTSSKDIYYIGYFGHGVSNEEGKGVGIYVKPTKSDPDDFYPYNEMIEMIMKNIPKGNVVLFVDACFSGGFASDAAVRNLSKRDRNRLHVISACGQNEAANNETGFIAYATQLGKVYMLGTYNMADGLNALPGRKLIGHRADSNKDKKITIRELRNYMNKKAKGKEHPRYYSVKDKFVVFSK